MLSVIIPTKEEPLIQELADKIHECISMEHEIIVVDKSAHPVVVNGARVLRQQSDGLGNAFMEGLKAARGDVIALMDGDFSHDPRDLEYMLGFIKNYDIVIGSKRIKGGKTEDPLIRRLVTVVTGNTIRLITGLQVKDPMTGFAVMKHGIFDGMVLRPRGYKIVLEIMYKAKKRGFTLHEAPITFHARKAGESKVGLNMKGTSELLRIIKLAIDLRRGKI